MEIATYNSSNINSDSSSKILVIGETGSGKSTFINYLTNYFKNGTLNNLRVAIKTKYRSATENYSHSEANTDDTTKSQTTECFSYKFSRNGRNYIFLDTPGLSDTEGKNQDDINIDKIITSVESFDGITCVLIVMNGTVPRLTLNVQNVFVRLQGFLPDIIMENVIIVLTNVHRHAVNTDLEKILRLQSTIHPFYMQNSAFSTDPAKWDQQAMKYLQTDWEVSMKELKRIIDLIGTFNVKSVQAFTDMKTLRNDIKSMMHKARLEVENIQKMQDEIAALQSGMKSFDDDITKNKDYTRKVAVAQLDDAPYHSTICSACNNVCHNNCGLNETYTKGDKTLSGCSCIGSNDRCNACPGHCSYTQHYHARKTMSNKQQTVDEVLHDIKAKFDAATSHKNTAQQKLTSASGQKRMLENALKQKNEEIKRKCLELKKHCSGFNIVAELGIMVKQLDTSKQTIKDFDALRQAEIFIDSLKAFCCQLEADGELSDTKSRKKMSIQDTSDSVPAATSSKFIFPFQTNKSTYDQPKVDDDVYDNKSVKKRRTNEGLPSVTSKYSSSYKNLQPEQQHRYGQTSLTSAARNGKQIYVSGFAEGALNRDDLERYFGKFGKIIDCFVPKYLDGRLKGFGFVEFDNYNTVTNILKQNHTINNYTVDARLAWPKREQKFQQQHPKRSGSANSDNSFRVFHNTRQGGDEYSDSHESTSSYRGKQNKPNRPLRNFGNNPPLHRIHRDRPPMRDSSMDYETSNINNYPRDDNDNDHTEMQDQLGASRGYNHSRGRTDRGGFQQY